MVALNKVDRCYEWQSPSDEREALCRPLRLTRECQPKHTQAEFDGRVQAVIDELLGLGISAALVGTPECASAEDALLVGPGV